MANSTEYKLAIQIAGSLASSFTSSVGQAQSRLSALGAAAGAVLKATAAAAAAAGAALGAFAASSVKTGMEFDSAMSQVAATMGTTTDNIQDLRDFAQQMGASTAFSATEAAEALNYMALAGYSAEQSMEMLPKVLSLAAAGGIDLASASDMVTDAQSALGLTAGETAAMVDQMAKASSKTNTSVAQLGEALLTIGATGQTAAGGTQELNQVLGLLADNGIKGAEGGTHLRNVMLSLQAPTSAAAKAMEALGVSAFDSQGSFRDMQDIFLDLQGSLDGLSEQERADVLSTMFNKTDLAAVNALLGTSAQRWDEVAAALADCGGAADAMAATQLDNLAGDITLFQSALEGAQIAVSDQLTPSLREFVQFGSEGLSELTAAFQSGGLDGAMEALGGLLSQGLGLITAQIPGFMGAGMKLLGALGRGLLDNLPAITGAALDVALVLADGLVPALPALAEGAVQIVMQLADGIAGALPELLPAVTAVMFEIVNTLTSPDTLTGLLEAGLGILLALADGLIDALPGLIAAVPVIIQNLADALLDALPTIADAGVDLFTSLAEDLPAIVGGTAAAIPAILRGLTAALQTAAPKIMSAGVRLLSSLAGNLPGVLSGIAQQLPGLIQGIAQAVADLAPALVETGMELFMGLVGNLPAILAGIAAVVPSIIGAILAALSSLPGALGTLFQGAWEAVKAVFAPVGEFFQGVWDTIVSLFTTIGTAVGDAISGAVKGAVNALMSGAVGIINGFISAINFAIDVINAIPGVDIGRLEPLAVPQLAQGGIVTAPTLLEAGEAGDEAIIPLPQLWENVQGLMAGTLDGAASRLADALALGNGGDRSWSGPLDWDGDAPAENGYSQPPLVIYYQPHLYFEGSTPSREDIVEAGRISQEEFNRMAAKWQKDAARLSLRG